MLKKRLPLLIAVLLLALALAAQAHASPRKRFDPGTQTCRIFDFESGWWGQGNKIFKARCKSCHTKDNKEGATFLYSESKSPKGWNRVFHKKRAQCYKDGHWAGLSLEEQLMLNDYLYRNGANTYDPNDAEDCG
ncbi:MAG: hypothetical protein ABFR97_10115 [Thermodesulfobacteriota bacterium]